MDSELISKVLSFNVLCFYMYWQELEWIFHPHYSASKLLAKLFNGMLRHSLGGAVIFISLKHFIASALDF